MIRVDDIKKKSIELSSLKRMDQNAISLSIALLITTYTNKKIFIISYDSSFHELR